MVGPFARQISSDVASCILLQVACHTFDIARTVRAKRALPSNQVVKCERFITFVNDAELAILSIGQCIVVMNTKYLHVKINNL